MAATRYLELQKKNKQQRLEETDLEVRICGGDTRGGEKSWTGKVKYVNVDSIHFISW